jgi:hypothetical protein
MSLEETERHPTSHCHSLVAQGAAGCLSLWALGRFLKKKRFRNSTSVTLCASEHPRSRKFLMFDSVQSCDMLLWALKVSDSGHRFTLTEERNTVEQSRGK